MGLAPFYAPPQNAVMSQNEMSAGLGSQFVYANAGTSETAVVETPLILLSMPSSSGLAAYLDSRKIMCLTAAANAILNFYSAPTVSGNGTAQTPLNMRPGSSKTALLTVGLNPTVSANGTLMDSIAAGAFLQGVANQQLIIDPGQIVLVTFLNSANPTKIAWQLSWGER